MGIENKTKDEFSRCQRCGRVLKNPKYRQLGFGPACYKKHLKETKKNNHKLF